MTDQACDIEGVAPKPKRGGRKPGSKNKPKLKPSPFAAVAWENPILADELDKLARKIADMREVVANCCTLLQQAMALRIGCMDSESRVADITKQRAQLEQEAHERLRAML